jgi:DUF1680 family protein
MSRGCHSIRLLWRRNPFWLLRAVARIPNLLDPDQLAGPIDLVHAKGRDSICWHLGYALFIHAYSSATLEWPSHRLRLKLESADPANDRIKLTLLESGASRPFSILLKIPQILDAPRIAINGRLRPASLRQGYVRLHRRWETGDIVEVSRNLIWTAPDSARTPFAES